MDAAYNIVGFDNCDSYADYLRTVALVSIAVSQRRQADSMDKLGTLPSFDEQLAAVAEMVRG